MIIKQGKKTFVIKTPPRIPLIGEKFSLYTKKIGEVTGRVIDVEHDICDTTSGPDYTVTIILNDG